VQARADWQTDEAAGVGGIASERLVFIDESAVLTSMVRRYGRSPRGQRAYAKVPFGNWKRLSVLTADRRPVGTSAPTSHIGGGGINAWSLFDRLTRTRAGGG